MAPEFIPPKDIPEVSDATKRTLQRAFASIAEALRDTRGQYVDRRATASQVPAQPAQVVHERGAGRNIVLPDPRPYRGKTISYVVEEAPSRFVGAIQRQASLDIIAAGAYELLSTGDTWWVLGGSTGDVAGLQGEQGVPGTPGAAGAAGGGGAPGRPGRQGDEGLRGRPGPIGPVGPQAYPFPGPRGFAGEDGGRGVPGRQGEDGRIGVDGAPGARGRPGMDADYNRTIHLRTENVTTVVGGVGFISTAVINLGAVALWSGSFDITGLTGLTPGQPVFVSKAVTLTDPTEAEEEFAATGYTLNSTTIRCFFESVNGPIGGTITVQFSVASSTAVTVGAGADFTSVQRADSDIDNTAAQLTVLPTYNLSRDRVKHYAQFTNPRFAVPLDGFTPGGRMQLHPLASLAEHPGITRCVVPLGQTGYLHMGNSPAEALWDPATLLGFRAVVRLVTANIGTDYLFGVGLGNDMSDILTPGSAMLGTQSIYYVTGGGGTWEVFTQNAGSTGGSTGTADTVGNWFVLEASRLGGTWEFFINGASEGPSSTNIPTALQNFGLFIVDFTGGSVDFAVDIDELVVFTDTLGQRWTS